MSRLATWNVESIRAHHDQVLAWVAEHQPDVLAMTETKCAARLFPRQGFSELGYELVIHGGEGGRGGVAFALRDQAERPVTDVQLGIPGSVRPLDEPRSISLTWNSLRLHAVYAPNGRKVGTDHHRIKLAWFELLRQWLALERQDHSGQVLLGDLNIAPRDLDVWEPRRYRSRNLTSPPERAAFEALLDDGLVDVVRQHLGEVPVYSWWNRRSDFYESDRGWRLDHVLIDPVTARRVQAASIDRAERGRPGSTDHAPVVVDLVAPAGLAP